MTDMIAEKAGDGILIVDKPANMTSARLAANVKKMIRADKAGHAGTLDPFATGVMICCLNRATRIAGFFLHGDKTYDAALHLGIETDTLDVTGKVLSQSDNLYFDKERIESVIRRFQGRIMQSPPVYSALKHHGVPLYKLARKGTPVQKPPKEVLISEIRVTEIQMPEVRIHVRCSGGTYIRSLASDIGKSLGCGAHLKTLRRIESGGFTIHDAVSLPELENDIRIGKVSERMISMSDALKNMCCHVADENLIQRIMVGKPITKTDIRQPEDRQPFIKIVTKENELIAVIQNENGNDLYKYCCVFHKLS